MGHADVRTLILARGSGIMDPILPQELGGSGDAVNVVFDARKEVIELSPRS
jgi:hypothetical protein